MACLRFFEEIRRWFSFFFRRFTLPLQTHNRNGICSVATLRTVMAKRQILLISDMAGLGKVATAAMLPILSYMGHQVYTLPTMLISNTFEYGKYEILETTDYIQGALKVWKQLGFAYDAIATGFIVSERQARIVADYCREQAQKGAPVFVDPVMGDEGKLYSGSSPVTVRLMKEMLSVAQLCYPNYTEACLLTDTCYKEDGVTMTEACDLLDGLRAIGSQSALITSILVDGQPSVVGYNHLSSSYFCLPYTEIPVHFPGTGDIFSAVLIGHLLDEMSLEESTQRAMDAVYQLIDINKDNPDKNRGIPIERSLNLL